MSLIEGDGIRVKLRVRRVKLRVNLIEGDGIRVKLFSCVCLL